MIRNLLFFLLIMIALYGKSQVTIIVTSLPENTPSGDPLYIAGNFNGWNPGDADYMLEENASDQPEIELSGTGTIEFKFTRGSWETVEGDASGQYLPNRSFTFGSADTLEVEILSWEDLGGTNHTAAENVIVMDEDFYMPQLDRYRRIWIYLPPDYETSGRSYPVMYMHDGQNLFDATTSFVGEWEVDETLNELFDEGKDVPIVVGIDHGDGHRIGEYSPWENAQYGGGEGELYTQFIVETLKPYIDENYRTLPDRENTAVMGSSLGGLISQYIALRHQDIFSKAGIFSPAYWFNEELYDFTYETGKQEEMKFYVMGGTAESGTLVDEMMSMIDTLQAAGFSEDEMALKVVPGGQHNEQLWLQQFGEAYSWLFPDSSSSIDHREPGTGQLLRISGNEVFLSHPRHGNTAFRLEIFTLSGQRVFLADISSNQSVTLPQFRNSIYLARLSNHTMVAGQKIFIGR